MKKEEIQALLRKYAENSDSDADRFPMKESPKDRQTFVDGLSEDEIDEDLKEVFALLPQLERPKRRYQPYFAAAIVVFALIGTYFLLHNVKKNQPVALLPQKERFRNDVSPMTGKARLILSDGAVIPLDNTRSGWLANQEGTIIFKNKSCELTYKTIKYAPKKKLTYNTIVIPRGGGKYRVTLSDGSEIWLNAGTTLTYPVVFLDRVRKVKLVGEAYFSLVHHNHVKYVVETDRCDLEDMGTEFNVMSYHNDAVMNVTLLKGAIKITTPFDNKIIKKGQQAQIGPLNTVINIIDYTDTGTVLAWRNNEFQFDDDDLKDILRQIERWYDVEVDFSNVPNTHFKGKISLGYNLSQVLDMLEKTGNVKFAIEGRKLKVLP